jgi:hypothetical protein
MKNSDFVKLYVASLMIPVFLLGLGVGTGIFFNLITSFLLTTAIGLICIIIVALGHQRYDTILHNLDGLYMKSSV